MKINSLDKILDKEIYRNRVCKIKYSNAFENCLKDKLLLLKKGYNVYSIHDLFNDTNIQLSNRTKFADWIVGVIKNLLGMHPETGIFFTIVFTIGDTISFLKQSDIEKLKEHVQLKEKPHKKYKKLKNIIVIENSSYMTLKENEATRFIIELIEKKYIVNTLIIICEPMDYASNLLGNEESEYKVTLDKVLIEENFGLSLENNYIKLLNVLGIEYIDYIKNIDELTTENQELLINKIINDSLKKAGYEEENLFDFLKLCSLLFDVFSHEDIENVSNLKNINYQKELHKSVHLNILENELPNEYRFLVEFLRKYYQQHAQFYESDIKQKIFEYLKDQYPNNYTDLALVSILTTTSNSEKFSLCLKSLYYESNTTTLHKRDKIIDYLTKTKYPTLALIPKLNEIYQTYQYSEVDAPSMCMQSYNGLAELEFLPAIDRLICLRSISKVSYEVMSQEFLKEIDKLYRKLLGEIRISQTYKQHYSFIFDYLAFSTGIEDSYETTEVVQRLVSYMKKINLPLHMKIRFLRLGNALFYNDYSIGLKSTEQAYNLSGGYPVEQKYSAINYSCSLGMCGRYNEAQNVLGREFKNLLQEQNAVSLSATNNYIINTYLSGSQKAKWLVNNFINLVNISDVPRFSDKQIINNNLLAAYIEENYLQNSFEIENKCKEICANERDLYHLFHLHHNMLIYYFLKGDLMGFKHESDLCRVPALLSPYSAFFSSKIDFMQDNIDKHWNIKELEYHLSKWGEQYPETKFSLYKHPVLYGFIERWFE